MPIDNQHQQQRRQTRTRFREPERGFDPNINLDGPENLGSLAAPQDQSRTDRRTAQDMPDRPTASGAATRQRTQGIGLPDELRGYLDRLADIDDEISDQEAAGRAGLDQGTDQLTLDNLPAEIRSDVATINTGLRAAGKQYPEWHTINNLPGYMKRAIRAMGRGAFRMFTNTDLEDITTIAHVGGQGPNTAAEVKAVAAWLSQNAENLGRVEIDYSRIMPGYEPEVMEFRHGDTRFHVVRDPAGIYIYAYPEADAVDHSSNARLGSPDGVDHDDDERDEFGARIKRLNRTESKMEKQFGSIAEQIRHYTNVLESLQEQELDQQQSQQLWETVVDTLFEASSLIQMLRGKPGAEELATKLHQEYRLASGASRKRQRSDAPSIAPRYRLVPERLSATGIKASKDNFAIIVCTNGVAAVKPLESAWDETVAAGRAPTKNNAMKYQVIWAKPGQVANTEIQKYRLGLRTGGGGSSGAEGGAPNLFQVLIERIGRVNEVYLAEDAVERIKRAARDVYQKPPAGANMATTTAKITERLKPVLTKMLHSTIGQIQQRAARAAQAGNFEQASSLGSAGKEIQNMLTALDVSGTPDFSSHALRKYEKAVRYSVQDLLNSADNDEEKQEILNGLSSGRVSDLRDFLDTFRQTLFQLTKIY